MSYPYSVPMLCPAADAEAVSTLAEALGHGPNTMSVPLSADGSEPATHFGAHAWARQQFIDTVEAGKAGEIPQALQDAGYTGDQAADLLSRLTMTVSTEDDGLTARERFDALLAENGLQRVIRESV